MAKRHHHMKHQSPKDRMHERHGEEHHIEKKMAHKMAGHYEGHAARRRMEMEDAGMIREDHSAVANLPQGVMMKSWPKGGYGMREGLNDTISGIDRQMDRDDSQRNRHENPHKY